MEMLKNINDANWKRPIYFATTIGEFPLNLSSQLMMEGIAYRITPGTVTESRVNTDVAFDNMVNKFKWGGIDTNPNIYLDENNLRMCRSFRLMFSNLIAALLEEGKKDKALTALDKCVSALPASTVPRGGESLMYADSYYELGQPEKGQKVMDEILIRADRTLQWYTRMNSANMRSCSLDIRDNLDTMIRALDVYQRYDKARYEALKAKIFTYTELYLGNGVSFMERSHPLDLLLSIMMRGYSVAGEDTTKENSDAKDWEHTIALMQKFTPQLLQKYQRQQH